MGQLRGLVIKAKLWAKSTTQHKYQLTWLTTRRCFFCVWSTNNTKPNLTIRFQLDANTFWNWHHYLMSPKASLQIVFTSLSDCGDAQNVYCILAHSRSVVLCQIGFKIQLKRVYKTSTDYYNLLPVYSSSFCDNKTRHLFIFRRTFVTSKQTEPELAVTPSPSGATAGCMRSGD